MRARVRMCVANRLTESAQNKQPFEQFKSKLNSQVHKINHLFVYTKNTIKNDSSTLSLTYNETYIIEGLLSKCT